MFNTFLNYIFCVLHFDFTNFEVKKKETNLHIFFVFLKNAIQNNNNN